jgi:hypothetical protein
MWVVSNLLKELATSFFRIQEWSEDGGNNLLKELATSIFRIQE